MRKLSDAVFLSMIFIIFFSSLFFKEQAEIRLLFYTQFYSYRHRNSYLQVFSELVGVRSKFFSNFMQLYRSLQFFFPLSHLF